MYHELHLQGRKYDWSNIKKYICHFLKVAPALVVDTHQAGVRVKNCLAEVDIIPTVVFCPVIPIILATNFPNVQHSGHDHKHPVHLHTNHWKYGSLKINLEVSLLLFNFEFYGSEDKKL